jgi:heme/copper-type cytochrome/quinol oxidase subunit 4
MTVNENQSGALKKTAIAVGVALAVLTVGSYVLGIDHLLGFSRIAMAIILVVAFVKVWLVTQYFMDIRHAPRWLGRLVYGWILLSGTIVVGLYIGL